MASSSPLMNPYNTYSYFILSELVFSKQSETNVVVSLYHLLIFICQHTTTLLQFSYELPIGPWIVGPFCYILLKLICSILHWLFWSSFMHGKKSWRQILYLYKSSKFKTDICFSSLFKMDGCSKRVLPIHFCITIH